MAPTKKKKKAAANTARGFATVSVPSKASAGRQENEFLEQQGVNAERKPSEGPENASAIKIRGAEHNTESVQPVEIRDMSAERFEEHLRNAELQSIVDDYGPRCKAEATRQAARLEAEKRMLRSQAIRAMTSSRFTDLVVNDVLKASVSSYNAITSPAANPTRFYGLESETDLLTKLWTLQQTLVQLKFPAIDDALLNVVKVFLTRQIISAKDDIWGLSETLEWYALNASDFNLPNYDHIRPKLRNETDSASSTESNDEGEKAMIKRSSESRQSSSPSRESSKVPVLPQVGSAINDKTSLHSSPGFTDTEAQSDSDDDNDPSRLVDVYLQTQSSLFECQQKEEGSAASNAQCQKLQDRLNRIERDVLFDEDAAATAWRDLKPKLLAALVSRRLLKKQELLASQPAGAIETGRNRETPVDHEEEMGLDDMFGELSSPVESSQPSQATSLHLVDFGAGTGVHPRRLLEEFCKLRDPHCQIMLRLVSSSSYAFRHGISIKWSLEQPEAASVQTALPSSVSNTLTSYKSELEMLSIATPTKTQSEAYICTLALFTAASHDPRGQKISLRLPPTWRDVWMELTEGRTKAIQESDKSILRQLRSLISDAEKIKQQEIHFPKLKIAEERPIQLQDTRAGAIPSTSRFSVEQAKAAWTRKTSTASFKAFLCVRKELPIYHEKDRILQTIADQAITIICAETSAGKSTQVPSYILERELGAGRDCRIIVTQPRRISAISLARRVSQELGEGAQQLGSRQSLVGYAIRLETKTSESTRITFATTGVLLRILENSPELEDIDYVILDEVHERTMDLDLLFIALKRVIVRRPALKLVLMSATIDAQKLSDYFTGAPILDVAGRTYPVEVGYLEDAIEASIDTLAISKSISRPEADANSNDDSSDQVSREKSQMGDLKGYSSKTRAYLASIDEYRINYDLITTLVNVISSKEQYLKYSRAILIFMPGIGEIRRLHNAIMSHKAFESGWVIHLLHSSFSSEALSAVFESPPSGTRKLVIATNIAETGITIPDVTAVIDTCKENVMRYDERRQVSKLVEGFISRSSSRQRRGRAARVAPGLCFHLVTKLRYETLMSERHVPEMLRLSLQDAILRVKIWDLGDIEETLAAAIDPPTKKNIGRAVSTLTDVGALTTTEVLTPLGKHLARLPLDVEIGKLAILGIVFGCLDAAITIAAILSSKSPFQAPAARHSTTSNQKTVAKEGEPDLLSTYIIHRGWRRAKQAGAAVEFCRKESLGHQNMIEIEEQRLTILVSLADAGLVSLDEEERSTLRMARLHSSGRESFVVPQRYQRSSESEDAICSVIAMAFFPKLLVREGKSWRSISTNQYVKVPRSSTHTNDGGLVKWMSFYQTMQVKSGHLSVKGTAMVPESAILLLLGQAEFKIFSGVVKVDGGHIQFAVRDWRTLLAMKILRDKISALIARFLRQPATGLTEKEETWFDAWLVVIDGKRERRAGGSL